MKTHFKVDTGADGNLLPLGEQMQILYDPTSLDHRPTYQVVCIQ